MTATPPKRWNWNERASVATVVVRLVRTAKTTWPNSTEPPWRVALKMLARKLMHLPRIHRWFNDESNPALRQMLVQHPYLLSVVGRPYMNVTWPVRRRLDTIEGHYRLLRGPLEFLRFPPDQQVVLARLEAGDAEKPLPLELVLDKAPWFSHEGELVLSLFRGTDRLYSLAFTLAADDTGRYAYLGALQGWGDEAAMQLYRDITHGLHGQRPRDLLLNGFRLLCQHLCVNKIRAISDSYSASRSSYFMPRLVVAQYDAVWAEHDGIERDDGFFDLGTVVPRRSDADIPSRKRAQYRRRYAMFDDLSAQIGTNVEAARARVPAAATEPVPATSPSVTARAETPSATPAPTPKPYS